MASRGRIAATAQRLASVGLDPALRPAELVYLRRIARGLRHPPVFIVGPPRSGTTFFHQILIAHFQVSYISNFACLFPHAPVLATRLFRRRLEAHSPSYRSRFGLVEGLSAPNEGGAVWNRWFPTEWADGFNYTDERQLDEAARTAIQRTVAGIETVMDAPFVSKNTKQSVRIRALADLFPESLFVEVRRSAMDTALSILHARRSVLDDPQEWLWTMPREIETLRGLDLADQIAGQVHYIATNIEEDADAIGHDRRLVVHYDEICSKPETVVERFARFFDARATTPIVRRKADQVLVEGSTGAGRLADANDVAELTLAFERLE